VERAQTLGSGAVIAAAIVLTLVFSAGAQAAPGDLDLTFSGDGKQTTDFQFGSSRAAAVVRQPDGKIVAVGADGTHGGGDFALARYNANGSLDASFSATAGRRPTSGALATGRPGWRSRATAGSS
jgi:beta-propeller uncharacterized protein DUF5122